MAPYGIQVTAIAPGLMRTGGHVNAVFKGNHDSEARWFSAAATMPGLTMSAQRAARLAVDAIRQGSAVKVLSAQADLLARLHGAFPGLVPNILSGVSRLRPNPTADTGTERSGRDLQRGQGRVFQAVTSLGRSAGARLNQSI
jgi:short-subunit dehydrogenase